MTLAPRLTALAAAALVPLLTPGTAAAQRTASPATAAPAARFDHVSIAVVGRGSPVILIPGLATPRAVWDGIVPTLAKTRSVHLVQVNGFAGDAPGANLRPGVLDGIVADLHAYIAANRLVRPAVIGHSLGGLVGLMLAKAHQDDLGRLMVVDSLPYFAVLMAPPGIDPTPAMVAPQAAAMRDKVAAAYGKPVDPATTEKQVHGLALKPASIARMTGWAAAADPRVTAQAMYEDLTTDLRPDLAGIATPITLVYPWNAAGPTKAMTDPFYRRQFAAAPQVRFVDVGDSGHFVMLDQPEAFAAAVDTFLQ